MGCGVLAAAAVGFGLSGGVSTVGRSAYKRPPEGNAKVSTVSTRSSFRGSTRTPSFCSCDHVRIWSNGVLSADCHAARTHASAGRSDQPHTPADLETVDVLQARLDATSSVAAPNAARDHSHPASPRPPATHPSASARSAGRARAAAHPEWLAGGPGRTAAVLFIDAAEAARLARKRRTPFTSGTAWLRVNE